MTTKQNLIDALTVEGFNLLHDPYDDSYYIEWRKVYDLSYSHTAYVDSALLMQWHDLPEPMIHISTKTEEFILEYPKYTLQQAVSQIATFVAGTYFARTLKVNQ